MTAERFHFAEGPESATHGGLPNVPVPTTPLFGREEATRDVVEHARDPKVRLLTLTGPGGIGKTRLALAAAQTAGGTVAFVPLAAITHHEMIATAVLRALGIHRIAIGPNEQILHDALRDQTLLLVLDNLEHLLDGVPLLVSLLDNCPGLTVLATSRSRLGIVGEHVIPVAPLTSPDPETMPSAADIATAAGVKLFVDRAKAVHPAFILTAHNAIAIATICRRLDGLPLAIELAAARSRLLSPQALAARLDHRLELLTGGPGDAPARHQTMRDTIAWSVDLLTEGERDFWERLGVFEGGFTSDAAAIVGSDAGTSDARTLDMLESQVNQGLLRPVTNAEGEPRFLMLETAREYALERLAAHKRDQATRDAHATCFAAYAAELEPGLMSADPLPWFNRTEADLANFRAAMRWLRDRGELQAALALAGALGWFWTDPSYISEGRAWYDALLAGAGSDIDPEVLAKALMSAGDLADWHTDSARADALHRQALACWRAAGDRRGAAAALRSLGSAAIDRYAYDDAAVLLDEARTLSMEAGDAWNVAAATNLLGIVAMERGAVTDAIRCHEEALRGWQHLGDRSHFPSALNGLGWGRLARDQDQLAWESFEAALATASTTESNWDTAWTLVGFAAVAARHSQDVTAARLLAAAAQQRQRLGMPLRPPIQQRVEVIEQDLRATLGSAAFARSWAAGLALSAADSVREARAVSVPIAPTEDGLSPREREVLELLVEGDSDHEIANTLFITRRTASKHVAAILEKLGANNRTAAATIAHRRGLV